MFKINDYVVYGLTGVCLIADIKIEKNFSNDEIECYILQPVYHDKMIIKTPVDNPKVLMREIISKDEVLSIIASIPEKKTNWINNVRLRKEYFKTALRTGKSEELIKIIKTIYLEKVERSSIGKRLMQIDEDTMKIAEKQLYEEFAIALNISPDEVASYIIGHISY
jgi:Transcriptional regulators, similar to M. xanthus CarD